MDSQKLSNTLVYLIECAQDGICPESTDFADLARVQGTNPLVITFASGESFDVQISQPDERQA